MGETSSGNATFSRGSHNIKGKLFHVTLGEYARILETLLISISLVQNNIYGFIPFCLLSLGRHQIKSKRRGFHQIRFATVS